MRTPAAFAGLFVAGLFVAGLFVAGLACAAQAQDADVQTLTFADWTVRCIPREGLPPCDMLQSLTDGDTGRQVMQSSVAYAAAQDRYAVQIVLPLGFIIPPGVLIRIDDATDITDYPVTRCEAQGCFVERLVPAEALAPFRAGRRAAVIVIGRDGKPLVLPLSLQGFDRALDEVIARNGAAE